MRMRAAGVVVAAAILSAGCSHAAETVPVKQGFAESDTVWNFGAVKEGGRTVHEFSFRNDGTAPLTIKDVFASCGCTTPTAAKKVLAPGEATAIEVVFDSRGFGGPVEKFVYVATDRAGKDVTKFTIKATVTP